MKKRCPECGRKYVIPDRHVGKKFSCVDCGTRIRTKQRKSDSASAEPSTRFSNLPISLDTPSSDATFERLPEVTSLQQSGWFKIGTLLPFVVGVFLAGFALHYLYSQWQLQNRIKIKKSQAGIMEGNEEIGTALSNQDDRDLEANQPGPESQDFTAKEISGFAQPDAVSRQQTSSADFRQSDSKPNRNSIATLNHASSFEGCPGFDPTILQVDPLNTLSILRESVEQGEDCEAIFFGSKYGSPEFLELYRAGLVSKNATLRFDCAILSALWNQEVKRSLEIALNTFGNASDTDGSSDQLKTGGPLATELRIKLLAHLLRKYPELAHEAMIRVQNVGRPASQVFARSMLASHTESGEYSALANVEQVKSTRRFEWLKELATEAGGEIKEATTPPKVGSLVEFKEGNSIFSFGFPDLPKEDYSLGYVFDVDRRLAQPRWPMLDESWARQDLEFDWPKYATMKIYGVEFEIKQGPLIRIRTYLANQYSDNTYWQQSNSALPSPPTIDQAFRSQHDFDRLRYFVIDGVPKAQRYVRSGDYVIDFRWIGHNHNSHPAYLTLLMESLKVDPQKLEDAMRNNERVYQ